MNRVLVCAGVVLLLSGCLTTQHYNTGKTLRSGEHVVVWGAGTSPVYTCERASNVPYLPDSLYTKRCRSEENEQLVKESITQVSRKFRLGVRDSWGPFTGVNIGYAMEILVKKNIIPSAALEFDLQLGLPQFNTTIFHSMSAGWVVGGFPDNTLFLEYAISKEFGGAAFYLNFRESYLATHLYDMKIDESNNGDMFKHNQTFVHQLGFGFRYQGKRKFILPNQVYAHGTITAPLYEAFEEIDSPVKPDYSFSPSVGIGWTY